MSDTALSPSGALPSVPSQTQYKPVLPLFKKRFGSPAALQRQIDTYFAGTSKSNPPTMTGLYRHLKCHKNSFRSLMLTVQEHEPPADAAYRDVAIDAHERVVEHYEKLLQRSGSNTGIIFAMKNFGWRDDQHHQVNTTACSININVSEPATKNALTAAARELESE